jgi:hypothetical protein
MQTPILTYCDSERYLPSRMSRSRPSRGGRGHRRAARGRCAQLDMQLTQLLRAAVTLPLHPVTSLEFHTRHMFLFLLCLSCVNTLGHASAASKAEAREGGGRRGGKKDAAAASRPSGKPEPRCGAAVQQLQLEALRAAAALAPPSFCSTRSWASHPV